MRFDLVYLPMLVQDATAGSPQWVPAGCAESVAHTFAIADAVSQVAVTLFCHAPESR